VKAGWFSQCRVKRRPSSSPARASAKAPVQMPPAMQPKARCRLIQVTARRVSVSRGSIPAQTKAAASRGTSLSGVSGVMFTPQEQVTGALSPVMTYQR